MGYARHRSLVVTADGSNNYTAPCSCRHGGVVTLEGTFVANVYLQRRGADNNWVNVTNNSGTATIFTAPGTYTINPSLTQAEYRLGIPSTNFTSGSCTMLIEGW